MAPIRIYIVILGFVSLTQYSGSLVVYGLVLYLLVNGRIKPGQEGIGALVSTQVSLAMMLLYKLEALASISTDLSHFVAVSQRLTPLLPASCSPSSLAPSISAHGTPNIAVAENINVPNVLVSVSSFTLFVPNTKSLLVSSFSFTLYNHQSLLIVGESGVGKTTFVKALLGHRTDASLYFKYKEAPPCTYLYFTQTVFFVPLTDDLFTQILYPGSLHGYRSRFGLPPDDDAIRLCLEQAGLVVETSPYARFNTSALSSGERQRMSMARILLWRPAVVFLDEAFSSLSPVTQHAFYSLLAQQHISFVATQHPPVLPKPLPPDTCILSFKNKLAAFSCSQAN
jgi:vitamin B12/bleomycin/antimicrobial peptide transport system ATP-binding/permease protein